jgi:uncharacterized membrane protein
MRQRWSFLKTLYWSIAGLILGAILHISYVLAAPHLSGGTAWRQLSPQLPINEMKVLAPVKPGAQPLPFMAPDVRYAMCRFDLADPHAVARPDLVGVVVYRAGGEFFDLHQLGCAKI